MKVEWKDDLEEMRRADVQQFSLVVKRCFVVGRTMWRGSVECCGIHVRSEHHSNRRAAESWCESRLTEFVAPFVDAAIAEERAECARLVERLAGNADSAWNRYEDVLRDAALAIRYRSHEEPKP